jgi:hypothetical protein
MSQGILVRTQREKAVGGGCVSRQALEARLSTDDRGHLVANGSDELGKGVAISRRDFIGGVSTSVILGSSSARVASAPGNSTEAAVSTPSLLDLPPESYPPLRTGLRGQYPGSFEVAHRVRDGAFMSIVLAPADYAKLDLPESRTRIRLNSTVVRVEHIGLPDPGTERAVRVVYVQENRQRQVSAANVILACFNNIIPYIVPDLPAEQKDALHYASKVPLQSTSVLVRNWESLRRLGVSAIHAPNGYHTDLWVDTPLSIGGYDSAVDPKEPAVIIMWRNPNKPGLPRREQNRMGRAVMLAETFDSIERETRAQLDRMLGTAGFESRRDILGLTVNRWPHGYAYTYDTLGDPDLPEADRPHVRGRRMFGRIAIANADSGAAAFSNVAIDQAERAVQECLVSRGLT